VKFITVGTERSSSGWIPRTIDGFLSRGFPLMFRVHLEKLNMVAPSCDERLDKGISEWTIHRLGLPKSGPETGSGVPGLKSGTVGNMGMAPGLPAFPSELGGVDPEDPSVRPVAPPRSDRDTVRAGAGLLCTVGAIAALPEGWFFGVSLEPPTMV